MQLDLETEQASALAHHLEVVTRSYAAHLAQAQAPVDAIPEIVRHLQSVEGLSKVIVEAYTKEKEKE